MFRSSESPLSLNAFQDEMSRMLERVWHAGLSTRPLDGQPWAPTVDLHEMPDRYILFADVPGVEAGSIELSFSNRELTIRGEKVQPADAHHATRSLRTERRFGAFCRTIDLPATIEPDQMTARCHAGVLMVTIPKTEAARRKEIRIDVADEYDNEHEAEAERGPGSQPAG